MSDIRDWYSNVPIFTKYWMSLTVAFSLLGKLGVLKPYFLILLYEPLKRFQIWRVATCVFYYPTSFNFLVNLYFLYSYSLKLETGQFQSTPADYLFMLLFNWICCVIIALIAEIYLLMDAMVLSVLYVWCQLNKDVIVNFWFGTRFKAMYFPWVLLAFNMITSGGGIMELVGIVVGHLYFFLMFKYPQELGGPVLIQTPSIFKQWFPDRFGGVHGFGRTPERPSVSNREGGVFRRHNWGTGHVLGGN